MSIEYLDLADYVAIAAAVTGLDFDVVLKVSDLNIGDSALHVPSAGFGDDDLYPASSTRLRRSSCGWRRIIRYPMATKRAAWVPLRLFVDLTDGREIR